MECYDPKTRGVRSTVPRGVKDSHFRSLLRQEAMRAGKIASFVGLGLFLGFFPWGCQSEETGPLSPVSGRVAYKGVPLQGGTIVFVPDETKGQRGTDRVWQDQCGRQLFPGHQDPHRRRPSAAAKRTFRSGGGLVSGHGGRSPRPAQPRDSLSRSFPKSTATRKSCALSARSKRTRRTRSTSIWSDYLPDFLCASAFQNSETQRQRTTENRKLIYSK